MDSVATSSQNDVAFDKPCIPINLEFHNITVEVLVDKKSKATATNNLINKVQSCFNGKKEIKTIIQGISGKVTSGDLVAVMGASGAGKTSLLRVLSGYNNSFTGQILVNGKPRSKNFCSISCLIQQDDVFLGYLTTEEHLRYQSRVRIPSSQCKWQGESVPLLLSTFSLNKIKHSLIGNVQMGAKRGISGGEKKRLSIATELLTNPSIIFADEPTSGLDAFTAETVVATLENLAKSGRCVIATIHQPNSDIFMKFNKLLLLSEGRLIYFGDTLGCISYFLIMGHMCPPYANPADFIIETMAQLKLSSSDSTIIEWEEQWKKNGDDFLKEWETELKSKFALQIREVASAEGVKLVKSRTLGEYENFEGSKSTKTHTEEAFVENEEIFLASRAESTFNQFLIILKRALLNNKRNPFLFIGRIFQTIGTALLLGLVFLNLKRDDFVSKNGVAFLISTNQVMLGVVGVVAIFSAELPVVKREFDTGKFNVGAYFVAKTAADFFFQILNPILFTCVVWFLVGLNNNFLQFLLAVFYIFLGTNAAISLGYLIASISPSFSVAMMIVPTVFLPMILVSGFLIVLDTLPVFWTWLLYIAPTRWIWSGIMQATWKDVMLDPCPPNLRPPVCFGSGNEVLTYYGLEGDSFVFILSMLLLQILLFRVIAFIGFVLVYRKKIKK